MLNSTHLRVQLTRAGREALDAELARLRAELPALAARIGAAREETPDPVENLGLRDALEALTQLETRIAERQVLLAAAEPVEEGPDSEGRIRVGAQVTVCYATGEVTAYILVSPPEASPSRGRISVESPVGRALIGARTGETVTAQTPDGPEPLVILGVC